MALQTVDAVGRRLDLLDLSDDDDDTSLGDEEDPPADRPEATARASSAAGGGRRSCAHGPCRSVPPPPAFVAFCAIQLEIADGAADVDINFNRGKSLEDVFCSFRVDLPSWSEPQRAMSSRKKARGRRHIGEVTVQTFTVPEEEQEEGGVTAGGGGEKSKTASKESTPASTHSASSATSASAASSGAGKDAGEKLSFVSGNPFVEVTNGVLHLYKENQTTSLEEGVIRSQMLCMLGVPAKIKTPDLLHFTAPCQGQLDMIRIITDGSSSNQFMVLLRFRCQDAADEFYRAFNGQRFNSLESDVCSLVYVSKVETCKESEFYPLASHTELPLCSICLERMDESVSTVLTILCNHTFHGSCLAQWEDFTCPVCRYVQTPEVVAEQRCSECRSSDDLWICLVCGYVGCGRYVGGHSHAHFKETHHCYTMELGQNRVWDYVGDNFVHRLMQTDSADGKLVEAEPHMGRVSVGGDGRLDDSLGGGGGGGGADGDLEKCGGGGNVSVVGGVPVASDEKMDSIQLEYTYLLTSQLEAQRRFYEEKIARLEEETNREVEEMSARLRGSVEENKEREEKLAKAIKDKAKSEKMVSQLNAKIAKLTSELNEEKQLNKSLLKNQVELKIKHSEMEKEVAKEKALREQQVGELQDQMRDLIFHLESQQKMAASALGQELEGGSVVGVSEPSPGAQGPSARRKGKRRGK